MLHQLPSCSTALELVGQQKLKGHCDVGLLSFVHPCNALSLIREPDNPQMILLASCTVAW